MSLKKLMFRQTSRPCSVEPAGLCLASEPEEETMPEEGKELQMNPLPEHGPCFVCGRSNPSSIGVRWWLGEGGVVVGKLQFTLAQQGPPGDAHGGGISAVLDEAMGIAAWAQGSKALAANLNVDFLKPVPLNQPLVARGEVSARTGRKVFTAARMELVDGTVAATATGLFVIEERLFEEQPFPTGFQPPDSEDR